MMKKNSAIDFSVLAENLPYLFCYVDLELRHQYQNKVFEEWFGRSRLDDCGRTMTEIMGSAFMDVAAPHLEKVLAGELTTFETVLTFKVGAPRLVRVTFLPDPDDQGKLRGFFLRGEDITDQRRFEEAALYFAAIVESSDDVIASKSLDGIIQSWNKGAERIFGYSANEIVGKHITTIIPPERHGEEDEIIARIKKGQRVDHFETIRVTKDGRKIFVSVTISPIMDAQGRLIGISKIARDITAQKNAEEEIVRSNRELEQFAYVASHDLQEPLRKIMIYSQLLDDNLGDSANQDTKKAVDQITSGVKRMQQLIEDLLSYSRAGRVGGKEEEFSLSDTVKYVLRDLEISIKEREATVTSDPLPTIRANRFQIHQVLQNLVANAIKFNEGTPNVHISAEIKGDDVIIAVRDNGIGIEPKYHEQIFKVFQRLHGRDRYAGTGIGLAICKKIVEAHGGKIWVESVVGQSSTFFFSLPNYRKDRSA